MRGWLLVMALGFSSSLLLRSFSVRSAGWAIYFSRLWPCWFFAFLGPFRFAFGRGETADTRPQDISRHTGSLCAAQLVGTAEQELAAEQWFWVGV